MSQPIDMFLTVIKNSDYYSHYDFNGKSVIVYDDHRFIVPILWLAKSIGMIKCPLNMVYFDQHHDANDQKEDRDEKFKAAIKILKKTKSFEEAFEITQNGGIRKSNDTWLKVLMDLAIVKDAVLIGGNANSDFKKYIEEGYVDVDEKTHQFKNIGMLKGVFDSKKILGNNYHEELFKPTRDIIGWYLGSKGRTATMNKEPILLDFDLDYFTFYCSRGHYIWDERFYHDEFDVISNYHTTAGWSGKKFLNKLIQRAPFITIAREPTFCGGKEKTDNILNKLSEKFFNGRIS